MLQNTLETGKLLNSLKTYFRVLMPKHFYEYQWQSYTQPNEPVDDPMEGKVNEEQQFKEPSKPPVIIFAVSNTGTAYQISKNKQYFQ